MPLKIFNTKSRNKEEFQPLHPPRVKMYVCGITAYDYCHLGHARAAVIFDVIYRYLKHKGFDVHYVRNFTDIDDKIINRANEAKRDWKEIAEQFIAAFHEDMTALGNLPPTDEPRATEYIEAMQEMIARLIEKGIAYQAEDADVFYSVRKFPSYGELANKNIEELESGARVEIHEAKKDPLDFALWKGAKPGEPKWPSPWGDGRPGWHIECSTMSTRLLGPTLDIHGGGRDLTFPHHENERAQSEGALGQTFVRYWMHNGFVNLHADKMSKSTGNFLTIRDVLKNYPRDAIRYFLLSSHYRSPLDFNDNNMREALTGVERVYQTLDRLAEFTGSDDSKSTAKDLQALHAELDAFAGRFEAAMDDDFNTAQVLGACFELVREINRFLDLSPQAAPLAEVKRKAADCFALMQKNLGLFAEAPRQFLESRRQSALKNLALSDDEIKTKIAGRKAARDAKDYKQADKIRDELAALGIILKDNPDGTTTWTVK
jgi:cysteinyl-tRNA synthetase